MMKEELVESKAEGRTVKEFHHGNAGDMIITFTDDTFICFGVETGYDPEDHDIIQESMEMWKWGNELVMMGIMTPKELDKHRKYNEDNAQANIDANDKKTYERLKAKFDLERSINDSFT